MVKTNTGLVDFVQKAFNDGWGYVYGTIGQLCTTSLLDDCARRCPGNNEAGGPMRTLGNKWLDKHVADCAGLIKCYIMTDTFGGALHYDSSKDIGANTMFNKATEKGVISTLPEIPGLLLHAEGHVGVYIGGGYAIEARGTAYGVVKTVVKNRSWTHWFKSTLIQYEAAIPASKPAATPATGKPNSMGQYGPKPTLKFSGKKRQTIAYLQQHVSVTATGIADLATYNACRLKKIQIGDRSTLVLWVQQYLNGLGFNCGVADGYAEAETMAGIARFQKAHGLGVGYLGGTDWYYILEV